MLIRHILNSVITLLLLACTSNEFSQPSSEANSNRIVINGKIHGSYWNRIGLRYIDSTDQNRDLYISPDSTEYFKFVLNSMWPGRFTLSVSDNAFHGVYFPGDSVFIEGELEGYNDEFLNQLTIYGNEISHYEYFRDKALNERHLDIQEAYWEAKRTSYNQFAQILDSLYLEELKLFQDDTVGKSLSQEFIDYELTTLKYNHLYNKLREPILRLDLSFDSTEVPHDYFEFIEEIQLNDQTASNNRDYYNFLNALNFRLSKPESLPAHPIIDRLEIITRMSHAFADTMLTGEVKNYFLSLSVRDYLRYDLGKADSLIQMLESMGINTFYLDAYKVVMDSLNAVAFQIPDSIEVSTLDNVRIKLIDSITSYTYLGIWSIGCKGCYIDFREKERIVKKHAKLKFVDICTTIDAKSVHEYLSKFGNTGTHFLDTEVDVKRTFNIQALPTYVLVDGEGKIIEHNFFRPGDPNLQTYFTSLLQ